MDSDTKKCFATESLQFEVNRKNVDKNGYLKNKFHQNVSQHLLLAIFVAES